MERNLLPFPSAGHGLSAHVKTSGEAPDDAYFSALFSGVSLQSFLTVNQNPTLFPSLLGGFSGDALSFTDTAPAYSPASGFFVSESTGSSDALRLPKTEPMNPYESEYGALQIQSCDFVHESSCFRDATSFPHLPDLRSLEHSSASSLPPSMKRSRVDSALSPFQAFDSIVRENFHNFAVPYKHSPEVTSPAAQIPRSALARQRRQKLSDKTRCLQKLLPWDKKMDIATMLEEAYKYVKFLKAQLMVLQSMPSESSMATGLTHYNSGSNGGGFSELERLNRNQLLQVLVNSPVAQTMLYSQSCCVFSAEQLGIIPNIAEKNIFLQQMPAFCPKP